MLAIGWPLPARRRYLVPKGLKPVRKRLADGSVRIYWYHRATGKRLQHDPATADGFLEVARLDDRATVIAAEARTLTGSYGALWVEYRKSPKWSALKPRTRSDYQAVRDWLGSAADVPLVTIKSTDLERLRDRAATEKGRRFANYVIQVLRLTMRWGQKRGFCKENPAAGLGMLAKPRGEARVNRAWSDDEVRAFMEAAPFHLLVPFALGLYAALRQGDALRLTWTAYDGRSLSWIAGKNDERVCIPVAADFKAILDHAKTARADALQIAVNSAGAPWSQSGFRASFFKLVGRLKRAGKLDPGCTFHGLRYTVAAAGREAGMSEYQVAAMIADRSTAMAARYGRDADVGAARETGLGFVQKRFANIDWKPRTPVSNRPNTGKSGN